MNTADRVKNRADYSRMLQQQSGVRVAATLCVVIPHNSGREKLSNVARAFRVLMNFNERNRLATTKGKRWNGSTDTLPKDFLNGVLEKMAAYGDRVQFSLVTGGPAPSYQIRNQAGKAIAFDAAHHLLRPENGEFDEGNATTLLTLSQVQGVLAGTRAGTAKTVRTARTGVVGTRASAARMAEQHAAERYAYFKENRQNLPAGITAHTEEIDEQMKAGKSAEEAFRAVVQKYF